MKLFLLFSMKDPGGIISVISGYLEMFGTIILLASIGIVLVILLKKKLTKNWLDIIPSLFPTVGILCTFAGIAYGLRDFQINNIDQSIASLLDGLKTAFYASIVGILGLIIFNFIVTNKIDQMEKNTEFDNVKTMENILSAFEKQVVKLDENMSNFKKDIINAIKGEKDDSLASEFSKTRNLLNELIDSIGSSKETSLISQIIKLRDEQNLVMNDIKQSFQQLDNTMKNEIAASIRKLDEINSNTIRFNTSITEVSTITKNINQKIESNFSQTIQKLDEFSKQLAESNTKALVESMEKVITDFNTQMKELVSRLVKENFEELNNSVKKLNEWQIENKKQVELLINQFNHVIEGIQITTNNVKKITTYSKQLVDDESVLKKILTELRDVMVNDKKFREISSKLQESVSLANDSIKRYSEYVNKSDVLLQATRDLIIKLNQIEKLKDMNSEFWKDIRDKLGEAVSIIQSANKMLNGEINKLDQAFYQRIDNTFSNLDALMKAVSEKYLRHKTY